MKRLLIILLVLALAVTPAALARGGGGGRSSGGGGGSKSGGGSKCCSGGSKSGGGTRAKPSVSKPSSGSKAQPKPVTKLIPPSPPKIARTGTASQQFGPLRVPSGRSYSRDRSFIIRNPQYADPYGFHYYGYSGSPFFYMWLFSVMDNDRSNNPLPPESDSKITPALLSYLRVIEAMDSVASGQ